MNLSGQISIKTSKSPDRILTNTIIIVTDISPTETDLRFIWHVFFLLDHFFF